MKQYFGKFRGKVENNIDPEQRGRIQVSVPSVLGSSNLNWALPCTPYAGDGVGFFAVPPVGANVWVEFEGGNLDHPIWVGGFWGLGEAPAQPAVAGVKMLKTDLATIALDEVTRTVSIETGDGAKISISPSGIEISNGKGAKVELSGPQCNFNDGAMEIV